MNIPFNICLIIFIIINSINSSNVQNVRKGILDYFAKHQNEAYKSDLDVIAKKDWLIGIFAKGNNDENKIRDKIISTLKHWKDINILDLNDTYFPSEFHATGHLILFGENRNHIPMANIFTKCMPPWLILNHKFIDIETKWFEYTLRKIVFQAEEKNWHHTNFFKDFRVDVLHPKVWINFISAIKLMDEKSPNIMIGVDLNPTAQNFVNGMKKLLNPEVGDKILFIDSLELNKYVTRDQLPKYVNGTNNNYKRMPSGAKSGKCLEQFKHISAKEWEDFKDKNFDCILEGLGESGKSSVEEYLNIACK